MKTDQTATISVDFMIAIAIFVVAFLYVAYSLVGAITPYAGESKEIFPIASRVSEMLVSDPGMPEDWGALWSANPKDVERIGFAINDENHNVLNRDKVNALMYAHQDGWWEFGAKTNTSDEYENATRALGIKPYDFYMQIRPIDGFDATVADEQAEQNITSAGDIIKIERIVTIKDEAYAEYRLILWMW
ncbi:MAG: hypothetical protein QMC78_04620 [Methanocellales archaeon]|nr:hypothetical protein [Methanocellales archaeon]